MTVTVGLPFSFLRVMSQAETSKYCVNVKDKDDDFPRLCLCCAELRE